MLNNYNYISSSIDALGPDVGSTDWHMDVIKKTYQNINRHNDSNYKACVTGKSLAHGGIIGRSESTGLGVFYCL